MNSSYVRRSFPCRLFGIDGPQGTRLQTPKSCVGDLQERVLSQRSTAIQFWNSHLVHASNAGGGGLPSSDEEGLLRLKENIGPGVFRPLFPTGQPSSSSPSRVMRC
jgi:hypothetical protein